MAESMRKRCMLAMERSKAWPTVFRAGSSAELLDAVLAELEKPTNGMVEDASTAFFAAGDVKYPDCPIAHALTAGARAAREGK